MTGDHFSLSRRPLTSGERALGATIFGNAIDYERVHIVRAKFWLFHPRAVTMAPDGHLWFHPAADHYCEDFACASPAMQAHFLHEMTHVWQAQTHGRWWLVLMRHPFCRYAYDLVPAQPFERYGIEQQAEIVRHTFLYRLGQTPKGAPPQAALEALLPFGKG